eukprot:985658-Rhodomonas_salina.1
MEGIELEAEGCEDNVESGLSAFEVPKFKARQCTRGDAGSGSFLDSLAGAIHYAQCMVWMRNAEFYDFH